MFTTLPMRFATLTAVIVADAPGASLPRLQMVLEHVPWDGVNEITCVRCEYSLTFSTLTSSATIVDRFVTFTVHVIRCPSATAVGDAVFVTARSTRGEGGG